MQFECASPTELPEIARQILTHFGQKVFLIFGDMGAGKTTFVQAVNQVLDCDEPASSPTFSLVNHYRTKRGEDLYHFDMYRLKDEWEALDIGYEEYINSGAWCFIEWPEKLGSLIPEEFVKITIVEQEGVRVITAE
jgi:tRNA threonylcarbamoyladenosine biosynthesis protein TsaE